MANESSGRIPEERLSLSLARAIFENDFKKKLKCGGRGGETISKDIRMSFLQKTRSGVQITIKLYDGWMILKNLNETRLEPLKSSVSDASNLAFQAKIASCPFVDAPPFPSLLRSSQVARQTSEARAKRWFEGGEVSRARIIFRSEGEQRSSIRGHCVRASAHNAQASEQSGHQWPTRAVAEIPRSVCHFRRQEQFSKMISKKKLKCGGRGGETISKDIRMSFLQETRS